MDGKAAGQQHAKAEGADPDEAASAGSKLLQSVQSALEWSYEKALDGLPGAGTLEELVGSYLQPGTNPDDAIDSLVAWQMGKAGTAGFVTGLGGAITLPAAIPANLASVLYI